MRHYPNTNNATISKQDYASLDQDTVTKRYIERVRITLPLFPMTIDGIEKACFNVADLMLQGGFDRAKVEFAWANEMARKKNSLRTAHHRLFPNGQPHISSQD